MPSPIPRQDQNGLVRSYSPIDVGFPSILGGSAPASPFSGPAQCLPSLRPTDSPSRLTATLYTEGFSRFVTSTTAPIATGWSEPVPGWDFPPTEDQRLFTAHENSELGPSWRIGDSPLTD